MRRTTFKPYKVSIVISALDSHMVVKRQITHFRRMKLPDSVEIILIDDGSDPPLSNPNNYCRNLKIYPTGDDRPWSQACARNFGALIAQGEYLLMTDIDHILTKELIESVLIFSGSKVVFSREYGVLNNHCQLTQKLSTLKKYGLPDQRRKHLRVGMHTNSFAMKRSIYKAIDGYPTHVCNRPLKGNKGDKYMYQRFKRYHEAGHCEWQVRGPHPIYTWPGLPEDPLGIFNQLPRGEWNAVQENGAGE